MQVLLTVLILFIDAKCEFLVILLFFEKKDSWFVIDNYNKNCIVFPAHAHIIINNKPGVFFYFSKNKSITRNSHFALIKKSILLIYIVIVT